MTVPAPNDGLEQVAAALSGKKRILVATHVYPDGDALGSQLAMGEILRALGSKVYLYAEQKVSHLYSFMPGSDRLMTELPDLSGFDAAVALDCGDHFRLGKAMDALLGIKPFVVIDHHKGHKPFGDLRWVDERRSSTGEMVYELAAVLGAELTERAAYCLYTAIVSDTGSFKYSSTSAATMRIASELLARGVKPAEVAGKLFDNYSMGRLQLLKEVLATLEVHEEGRIALITVTADMFRRTGASKEDTEDFINFPRALTTVRVAAFIKEVDDECVSVSLRAKDTCDVAEVAARFGGGGHRNAAGCRLFGQSVEEVRAKVLAALRATV